MLTFLAIILAKIARATSVGTSSLCVVLGLIPNRNSFKQVVDSAIENLADAQSVCGRKKQLAGLQIRDDGRRDSSRCRQLFLFGYTCRKPTLDNFAPVPVLDVVS